MSAAEHPREAIDVGCTRDDHDHVADHRAEVLAEAKTEVVAWLVKKATEQRMWDAGVLASKVDRGAVRAFLGTGHYRDAMDAHRAEVLRETAGFMDAHCEQYGVLGVGDKILSLIGKDTGGATQAPAGESTQPALDADRVVAYRSQGGRILRCLAHTPSDLTGFALVTSEDLPDGGICTLPDCGRDVLTPGNADDEVMRTVRRAIADFPFAMYGIDHDGADPAWVGDLASAIAGALGGEPA